MHRYKEFSVPLTSPDDKKYQSGLPYVEFYFNGDVRFHKVDNSEAGRLDLIAYKWYSDPSLYWIIAIFNNILDPIAGVQPGMDLGIPQLPWSSKDIRPFTYLGAK